MNITKRTWLLISIILLMTTTTLSIVCYNLNIKNKGYENALQSYLGSMMSDLITHINTNENILTSSLESKTISVQDANILGQGNLRISQASQNLHQMLDSITSTDRSVKLNNETAGTAQEFSFFISQAIVKQPLDTFYLIENTELITLTDDNLTSLTMMKEVTDSWLAIINKHIPAHSIPNDITAANWKNVVTDLSEYAYKLRWRTNQIYE